MATTVSSSKRVADPCRLTRKPITVVHQPDGKFCGCVAKRGSVYEMTIFEGASKKFFEQSKLFGKIRYSTFELAVKAHEVAHVIPTPNTFDLPFSAGTYVGDYVNNVFADDLDESLFMKQFPAYARYTQLLLACLKWGTPSAIEGTQLDIDLSTLFLLSRFGVIRPGADSEFVKLALPMVVSNRRGNHENSVVACSAIYEYLYEKSTQSAEGKAAWRMANTYGEAVQVPISDQDLQDILSGIDAAGTSVLDALKNLDGVSMQGAMHTMDGTPPDDAEKDDAFFREVCGMYGQEIIERRAAFLRKKRAVKRVLRFDGDVSQKRSVKHKALTMAMRGEEGRTQVGIKREKLNMEVRWLRDVSSSIGDKHKPWGPLEYAREMVIDLACLDELEGVTQSLIDFNSTHTVVMKPGDPVRKTRVYPTASGSTYILSALRELETWPWRGKERYVIIICDGDIWDWQEALPVLQQWQHEGVHVLLIEVVIDESITEVQGLAKDSIKGSFATTLQKGSAKILQWISSF